MGLKKKMPNLHFESAIYYLNDTIYYKFNKPLITLDSLLTKILIKNSQNPHNTIL